MLALNALDGFSTRRRGVRPSRPRLNPSTVVGIDRACFRSNAERTRRRRSLASCASLDRHRNCRHAGLERDYRRHPRDRTDRAAQAADLVYGGADQRHHRQHRLAGARFADLHALPSAPTPLCVNGASTLLALPASEACALEPLRQLVNSQEAAASAAGVNTGQYRLVVGCNDAIDDGHRCRPSPV